MKNDKPSGEKEEMERERAERDEAYRLEMKTYGVVSAKELWRQYLDGVRTGDTSHFEELTRHITRGIDACFTEQYEHRSFYSYGRHQFTSDFAVQREQQRLCALSSIINSHIWIVANGVMNEER